MKNSFLTAGPGLAIAMLATFGALGNLGCSTEPKPAAPTSTSTSPIPATPPADPSTPQEFPLAGVVTGLDAGGKIATVQHGVIQGFMPAMTMGYAVQDPAEFSKLAVGDSITATLHVTPDRMWITNVEKAPPPAKEPNGAKK